MDKSIVCSFFGPPCICVDLTYIDVLMRLVRGLIDPLLLWSTRTSLHAWTTATLLYSASPTTTHSGDYRSYKNAAARTHGHRHQTTRPHHTRSETTSLAGTGPTASWIQACCPGVQGVEQPGSTLSLCITARL